MKPIPELKMAQGLLVDAQRRRYLAVAANTLETYFGRKR